MTTRIDLGFPKLLPITGTWTLPFAAYLTVLSGRIVGKRLAHEKWMGDTLSDGTGSSKESDAMFIDSRAHANFLENVPLAFLLTAVAELNGGNRKALNIAMAALLAMRVVHVELGLRGKGTMGNGRPIGYFGSQGVLVTLAAYGGYLVKGYWGF
ncbi:MAG: hypothetical protein M1837_002958 [Sclerophora amabilis]|nr:MAG: hypothetical protein M1837_002958 [Sclerophora amabilis]